MLKLNLFIISIFLLSFLTNSSGQTSIGTGAIYNQTIKKIGLQVRLEKTYSNFSMNVKFEKYFLKNDFDLFAARIGGNFYLLRNKKYSIYSILDINLTGVRGIDLTDFHKKSKGLFGANMGLGSQFIFGKNGHGKIFTEVETLLISNHPEYFYKKPFLLHLQIIIGMAYVF